MNVVKFKDIVMTPEVLESEGLVVKSEDIYEWTSTSPFIDMTIDEFCEKFNESFRNKYLYVINWETLEPLTIPTGNPFDIEEDTYIFMERNGVTLKHNMQVFDDMIRWVDQVATLNILQKEYIKYNYLNEFTPDDDITIDELKVFRTWLASILYANTPVVDSWDNPEMLKTMLLYYKQSMNDSTTDILSKFSGYMKDKVLVAGTSTKPVVNLAALGLTSGCGCFGGVQGVSSAATSSCDPLQMYRNAIYNYMVSVFSNINYWVDQVEICVEMKKYIEGILKVGLPLGSRIIDPLADCGCNTLDSDAQARYRKMLESLIQALTYIISGDISGNKNYISTAFSNWATYLYEYMYWD